MVYDERLVKLICVIHDRVKWNHQEAGSHCTYDNEGMYKGEYTTTLVADVERLKNIVVPKKRI